MNKSKTLYILVLMAFLGIALMDHFTSRDENQSITVGEPEVEVLTHFQLTTLTE